jgi:signal transduction histidine kinase
MRTEMLDVLAHEVRQPLHNAAAAMESACSVLGSDARTESSEAVRRAQAVLGEVQCSLDNTLAVASLLARPDPIHLDDPDIDTLINVAIADMPAAERGLIRVRRETETRTVLMDVSLMRLALRNLLSNALKFSPPGGVVRVRVADSDMPLGLIIDVSDSGTGVPEELRARLFTRGGRGGGVHRPAGDEAPPGQCRTHAQRARGHDVQADDRPGRVGQLNPSGSFAARPSTPSDRRQRRSEGVADP